MIALVPAMTPPLVGHAGTATIYKKLRKRLANPVIATRRLCAAEETPCEALHCRRRGAENAQRFLRRTLATLFPHTEKHTKTTEK